MICLWFNDYRRIKERVDGMLSNYGGGGSSFFYRKKYTKKNMNFRNKNKKENIIQNEIQIIENDSNVNSLYRCFNQNNLKQPEIVLVKNDKRKNQIRLSQPLNMSFVKKTKQNFRRNLRQEMKNGIESIDEEDSNECKEKEINDSICKSNDKNMKKEDKEDEINIYRKSNDKKHSSIYCNIENKNFKNNNYNAKKNNTNSNVEEIKENTIDMNELYSNK